MSRYMRNGSQWAIALLALAAGGWTGTAMGQTLATAQPERIGEVRLPWQEGGQPTTSDSQAPAVAATPSATTTDVTANGTRREETAASNAAPPLLMLGPVEHAPRELAQRSNPAAQSLAVETSAAPQEVAAPGAEATPSSEGVGKPEEHLASVEPNTATSGNSESLKPIPDLATNADAKPEVYPASFNEITPGESTMADVRENMGEPLRTADVGGQPVHLFSVEEFNHIEIAYDAAHRVKSVMIRLPEPVDVRKFATVMPHLANIEPVIVTDELGFVLGQSFPERGILCSFERADEPRKATMQVTQVIFEPISAEGFLLRAEYNLGLSWKKALHDLNVVTNLDPLNARAHWFLARIYLLQGDYQKAHEACSRAVHIDPAEANYHTTLADILRQLNRVDEAIEQAQTALPLCENRPHVKARALSLIGDLLSTGAEADYQKAYEFHYTAIETAKEVVESRHPAIRLAAKEVLVDAHLGAAHDIAWGDWEQKELSVPRWLELAKQYATELIESEGRSEEPSFRVATRAVSCLVGMKGKLDPAPWIKEVDRVGRSMIEDTSDPEQKCRHQWNVGLVLFDAIQIYQMRQEYDLALKYGERAVDYLEQGILHRNGFADAYILARLYFRLGVIHAIGKENHQVAVAWFDKALPIFDQSADHINVHELGRFGETFVSMGVSYWQAGQQEKAVDLSQRGVTLIDRGVEKSILPLSKLETPYSNLAIMLRKLGRDEEADHYFDMAIRTKQTIRE